jgi:hypothetical protein
MFTGCSGNQTVIKITKALKDSSYFCRDEPMIPEEHEEVNMNDFDPEEDRRQRTMSEDDEDQMHGHGPGVSCATQ